MSAAAPRPYDVRKLGAATLAAALVAGIVLVAAVLPAEYGIDPTGLGRAIGFRALHAEPPAPLVEAADDATAPVYEMRATWRVVELPIAERSGSLSDAQPEARITIPIRIENLTSVTATLTWNDSDLVDGRPTEGDTLEIGIRGPSGLRSPLAQATNEPGQPGRASTTVGVASVRYPDESATGGLVMANAADTQGVGNWTFVVRLYEAGGIEGSDARDPGQAFTLVVHGEAYELDVQKQTERFGDRVRLTLAKGQGVEYKLEMQPNATMRYRWNASAPVHADLHGDRADDPDDFVSARIATLEEDAGTYVAPFFGRHGWYFRNDGAAPVTITLETAGDYRILGAV